MSVEKKLVEYMDKPTLTRVKEVADAFLEEYGDYPPTLVYEMSMVKIDRAKMNDILVDARKEFFKAKGKKLTPFPVSEDSI